jgi:hypothetical protein
MSDWLRPKAYHWLVLLVMMGICSVGLAWLSFGLFKIAMANFNLISEHGLVALMDGGLVQLAMIGVESIFALLFYLGFKGIEHELLIRWNGRSH